MIEVQLVLYCACASGAVIEGGYPILGSTIQFKFVGRILIRTSTLCAEGGASYVPSYVPYVSHKLRLRVPLRVLYVSPLRMSLRAPYVPYVSRTCPVRVPYVSRTCPVRQENLRAVRASRVRWKSRRRVTRRGKQ